MLSQSMISSRTSRLALAGSAAAVALAGLLALVSLAGSPADAARPKAPVAVVLGGSDRMPNPLCPVNCQVIPSVSGIQTSLPSGNSSYRIPYDGWITAWKIWLGEPSNRDRMLLNRSFGSPPQASISVLQRLNTPKGQRFRLQRKSPVVGLNRYLGKTATFRLAKPLFARKGQFVALSVPTWAPAFAAGLNPARYRWRASRQPSKCAASFVDSARPQMLVGSKRAYGCNFKGSRLLFTARLRTN